MAGVAVDEIVVFGRVAGEGSLVYATWGGSGGFEIIQDGCGEGTGISEGVDYFCSFTTPEVVECRQVLTNLLFIKIIYYFYIFIFINNYFIY